MISQFEVEGIWIPYSFLLQDFVPLLVSNNPKESWFMIERNETTYISNGDGIEFPKSLISFNREDCQIKCDSLNKIRCLS